MPYITVRGVPCQRLCAMAEDIREIVANTTGTALQYIKIFHSPVVEIRQGQQVETRPSLDVYWMPRPQEVCDALVAQMCAYFASQGFSDLECTFTEFPGRLFYDNGINYA